MFEDQEDLIEADTREAFCDDDLVWSDEDEPVLVDNDEEDLPLSFPDYGRLASSELKATSDGNKRFTEDSPDSAEPSELAMHKTTSPRARPRRPTEPSLLKAVLVSEHYKVLGQIVERNQIAMSMFSRQESVEGALDPDSERMLLECEREVNQIMEWCERRAGVDY